MQFKSFMEALKGNQHKIDKNKNGKVDAHDFKLLRKEEEELEEAKMSDADMAERERIVKGMKKNLSGFKAKYGERAKEVMYATATKQAMKEETLDEALDPSEIAGNPKMYDASTVKKAYYHKSTSASDKESLARHLDRHHGNKEWRKSVKEELETLEENHLQDYRRYTQAAKNAHAKGDHDIAKDAEEKASKAAANYTRVTGKKPSFNEEVEQIDERMVADEEGIAKKLVAKHGRNINAHDIKLAIHLHPEGYKTTHERIAAHVNRLLGKPVREETEQLDEAMINGREYASHGLMHPDHAARDIHKVTGQHIDFYAHGTGDKVEGKVTKNDGKAVHIKDTKGNTHKFKVQRGLPKQQNEEKKSDVPFDGPYKKAKPAKNSDGTTQQPMSRARELAKNAMKQKMKEEFDVEVSDELADSILDYYINEQAPQAPVLDRKYIKGTPEHKAYKATKKPINNMPTGKYNEGVDFDEEGNLKVEQVKFTDFIDRMNEQLLEYESDESGVYRHTKKATYGTSYQGDDDEDEKKPKQQSAEKRGRGRPAGAKIGARKITGTSKLYK